MNANRDKVVAGAGVLGGLLATVLAVWLSPTQIDVTAHWAEVLVTAGLAAAGLGSAYLVKAKK